MSTEVIVSAILRKMSEMNKWQRDFFQYVVLFLSLCGLYTYFNVEQYGGGQAVRAKLSAGFKFIVLRVLTWKPTQHYSTRSIDALK